MQQQAGNSEKVATTMLSKSHFDVPHEQPPQDYAHKRDRLPAESVVAARMWAMEEVSAAVAHQFHEPLTALLIYMHEIEQGGKRRSDGDALPVPLREIAGRAVREVERVCDILERMRNRVETPADTRSAVARGRDAIDAWARNGKANGGGARRAPPPPFLDLHPLTLREKEVLAEITAGASNKEGSQQPGISKRTFEAHRAHIMRKLGARNAADLVRTVLGEAR
ncbi:MAG: LuxR C-terminal-related transcriptional regulator [Hyphomicrobiales bacterium]